MALIYDVDFNSGTRVLSLLDKAGNVISSCEVPSKSNVDDITKPLTFKATQDGSTVKLVKIGSPSGAFQTSRDGGNTWTDYTLNTVITLNTGDKVSFRAKADRSAQNSYNYFLFNMTGKIEAWHNVMSMIRTNDFATYDTAMDFSFYRLFQNCTSLTKAPALPATSLADSCYYDMFGRTSLTESPALPATTLAPHCYNGILYNCESLTKAPALPATSLADDCYGYMFSGCRKLNEVHCRVSSKYSSSQIASNYAKNWLSNVSSTGTFYTNSDANWPSGESGIPTGWTRVNEADPAVDDPNKPLMLRAIEDNSSVTLTKNGTLSNTYQTSTNGTDWTDYTLGTQISLNKGESVYFRCSNHPTTQSESNYVQFVMTGKIEAWHNAYSMISSSFTNIVNSVGEYRMYALFKGCVPLTKAPQLPATTLENYCYCVMFRDCTSLTSAPQLPATTLAFGCYASMFRDCTSLTSAPQLPATTLAGNCYYSMFSDCTSLTSAPQLPATTLANFCYSYMFCRCTSLTSAPQLPATTLAEDCYYYMFRGCSKLKEVRVAATKTATDALGYWLSGVSSTGDFYCDPNATIFPSGESGIPKGWTRRALSDYPATP